MCGPDGSIYLFESAFEDRIYLSIFSFEREPDLSIYLSFVLFCFVERAFVPGSKKVEFGQEFVAKGFHEARVISKKR